MATAHSEQPKLNLHPKYFRTVAIGGVIFSVVMGVFNHVYFMMTEEFFPVLVMVTPGFLFPSLVGLFYPQVAVGISHAITVPTKVRVISTTLCVVGFIVGIITVYVVYDFGFWGLLEVIEHFSR